MYFTTVRSMVDSAAPLSVISTGRAQTFEDYVQLQAAAAEFTRQSWNSLDELQRRIQELEAELQVVSFLPLSLSLVSKDLDQKLSLRVWHCMARLTLMFSLSFAVETRSP